MVGIQQISDRMRTAPTQALRAVFAGIGRILLTADRPEGRGAATQSPDRASSQLSRQHQASQTAASERDFDKTGNVRLLSAEDMAIEFGIERSDRTGDADQVNDPGQAVGHGQNHHAVQNGRTDVADPTEPGPNTMSAGLPTVELPLIGYDDLSLASIRARLRNLDVGQLRVLAEYERSHAERPDVLGMFERRIEKLEAGG
jgi:hypothetical protein